MKDPTNSKTANSGVAGRNELYQTVIDLDQSSEDPSSLIDAVYDLVGVSYENIGPAEEQAKHSTVNVTPKSIWALRWFLKKLSGTDLDQKAFRLDPRVWRMLRFLVLIIPVNACNSLLVEHKFAETLRVALIGLALSLHKESSQEAGKDLDGKSVSLFFKAQEQAFLQASLNKSKKRKRDTTAISSDGSRYLLVYREMLELLNILKSTQIPNQNVYFDRPLRLDVVFPVEVEHAAEIFGNALSISIFVLQATLSSTVSSTIDLDVDLIEPFIAIWHSVTAGEISSDASAACLHFVEHCFMACLLVLQIFQSLKIGGGFTKATQVQLEQTLTRSFILPFRTMSMDTRKLSKEIVAEAEVALGELESKLLLSRIKMSVAHSVLPHVFELATGCCDRSSASKRHHEDAWLESLLRLLCQISKPDSETTESENFISNVATGYHAFARLLRLAVQSSLKLAKKFVEESLLHCHDLIQMSERSSDQLALWDVIGACVEADHTLVTPERNKNSSVIADRLLDSLAGAKPDAFDVQSLNPDSQTVYNYAFEKFLVPFVRAFEQARLVPSLLEIWRKKTQTCLDEMVLDAEDSQELFALPWLDERALELVSSSVTKLAPSQRMKYIRALVQEFKTLTKGELRLPALAIIGCFPLASDTFMPDPELVQVGKELSVSLAVILLGSDADDSGNFPREHLWRVWSLLAAILSGLDQTEILEMLNIEELVQKSRDIVIKAVKRSSTSKACSNFEGIFALRFLLTLLNSEAVSSLGLAIKLSHAVERIVKKLTDRCRELEMGDSKPMLITQARVTCDSADALLKVSMSSLILQHIYDGGKHDTLSLSTIQALLNQTCSENDRHGKGSTTMSLRYQDIWKMMLDEYAFQNDAKLADTISKSIASHESKSFQPDISTLKHKLFPLTVLHYQYEFMINTGQVEELSRVVKGWEKLLQGHATGEHQRQYAAIKDAVQKAVESKALVNRATNRSRAPGNGSDDWSISTSSIERLLEMPTDSAEAAEQSLSGFKDLLSGDSLKSFMLSKHDHTEGQQQILAKICLKMIELLKVAHDIEQFIWLTKNIQRILVKQAWSVTQYQIDLLLAVIERQTSSRSTMKSGEYSNAIFASLCRLLSSVLSRHLAKVGGRYHLVVPALNGLLRCLFENDAGASSQQIEHPTWLMQAKGSLKPRCATDLSRLLTSICDPTWSAAQTSVGSKGQRLNDPTKKARSLAGQSMLFVVIEYCKCQLRGHLEPLIREQILPGIYSILDAMTKDVMQHMNGIMNASERAIFKTLYDDWSRFGTWKGG